MVEVCKREWGKREGVYECEKGVRERRGQERGARERSARVF